MPAFSEMPCFCVRSLKRTEEI